jgi:hypothetical protein
MNKEDISTRLDRVKSGLRGLVYDVSRKGAKTIKEALDLLDYFEMLQGELDELWCRLADNSARHAAILVQFPNGKQICDLGAAFIAVDDVIRFLTFSPSMSVTMDERLKRLKILRELKQALIDLGEGSAPAPILRPLRKSQGRRGDVSSLLAIKGVLAGLMHCKQRDGMTRHEAAKWIATNMSPKLAACISRKPITARMVEEWLDRFGGKHAHQDAGRKTYLIWSGEPASLTKQKFKTITERIATAEW